jgi:adenylosuccinate lyase
MELTALTALSPLDGRYGSKTAPLRDFFSEFALIRYRVIVEIEWLKALAAEPAIAEVPAFSADAIALLDGIADTFSVADAERVKAIEATTNHDVKAVEYFLKDRTKSSAEIAAVSEFIHFACTSEDINCRTPDAWRHAMSVTALKADCAPDDPAHEHADLPMPAHHGQPARLHHWQGTRQRRLSLRCSHRIGDIELLQDHGAVGNYNAHPLAYPDLDWVCLRFRDGAGAHLQPYTIQIEPHDAMAELYDAIARANTILIDLNRDLWGYISRATSEGQGGRRGSLTMPHKVNLIDFENSEGNWGC